MNIDLKAKKEHLLACVHDAVVEVFYYNRKDCEEVDVQEVEYLIENGVITKEEVLKEFEDALNDFFKL